MNTITTDGSKTSGPDVTGLNAIVANGSRQVLRRHVGRPTTDGAGVKLTRVIGVPGLDMLDPFLMLDEFRSDDPAAYIAGFPEHPSDSKKDTTLTNEYSLKRLTVAVQGLTCCYGWVDS